MSDQAQPQGLNPDYVEPEFKCDTEREHQARAQGFRVGYFEGRDDLLFALAKGFGWATKAVEEEKARVVALMQEPGQ